MWITYTINNTSPIVPSALIYCSGAGFPWAKTCDWTIDIYIAPDVIVPNNGNCNQPSSIDSVLACNN